MTPPIPNPAVKSLAAELRDLLSQHLGEEARYFYSEEDAAFVVGVKHVPAREFPWVAWIESSHDDGPGTAMIARSRGELVSQFEAALSCGWVRVAFLDRVTRHETQG